MPDNSYIKVGCSKTFRDEFLATARMRGTSGKAVLLPAAEAFLRGDTQPTATRQPSPDPDHQMLDVILTKGTKSQIQGIRSNLQAFTEAIELRELKVHQDPNEKKAHG